MKITIENTDKLVELAIGGAQVPARVWQGETESGVQVHCFVTRIAVPLDAPAEVQEQFERELQQTAPLRPELRAYDFRYFVD